MEGQINMFFLKKKVKLVFLIADGCVLLLGGSYLPF